MVAGKIESERVLGLQEQRSVSLSVTDGRGRFLLDTLPYPEYQVRGKVARDLLTTGFSPVAEPAGAMQDFLNQAGIPLNATERLVGVVRNVRIDHQTGVLHDRQRFVYEAAPVFPGQFEELDQFGYDHGGRVLSWLHADDFRSDDNLFDPSVANVVRFHNWMIQESRLRWRTDRVSPRVFVPRSRNPQVAEYIRQNPVVF